MKKRVLSMACVATMMFAGANSVNAQFSGGGTGTEQNPYKIVTATDLSIVQNFVGEEFADKHFRLMNNVDLTAFLSGGGSGWTPIGDATNAFHGHIHGGGYEIQGLWSSGSTYAGFVGYLRGSIDSLGVNVPSGKSVSGGSTGVLVGYSNGGSITNCHATGDVSGSSYVGGLVGYATGAITNCYATGTVSGSSQYAGGLVGYATGAITNCHATSNISISTSSTSSYTSSYTGGLTGYATGAITNCYAVGDVSVTISSFSTSFSSSSSYSYSYAGGLVGYATGAITNSHAVGDVMAITTAGDSYSSSFSSYSYSGGLVGYQSGGAITHNYATGNVTANSQYYSDTYRYCIPSSHSGGLVGYQTDGTIANNYATGNVTANSTAYSSGYTRNSYAGGLVGYQASGTNTLSQCYATGTVAASNSPAGGNSASQGGVLGYRVSSSSNVSRCYYDKDITGAGVSPIGNESGTANTAAQGMTTSSMKLSALFMTWDFNSVWDIAEGTTYPYLQSNAEAGLSALNIILGKLQVCANSQEAYTAQSGNTGYIWTVTGGIITLGQYTDKITVRWDADATAGTLGVSHSGGTVSKAITIATVQSSITGNMNPLAGDTLSYITESGMNNYTWTATEGSIVSGQGTNEVQVKWDCTPSSSAHITVNYTNANGCTASAPTDSAVVIGANPIPTISGEVNPVSGFVGAYQTETGKTDYQWTVTGGTILSGQGTYYITIQWGDTTPDGLLGVSYVNANGCTVSTQTDGNNTVINIDVPVSTDASLSDLGVSVGDLDFDGTASQYNVYVANTVSSLAIQATATKSTSTIAGTGVKTLNVGQNNFEIVITAEDGVTTQTYTVMVYRADAIVQNDLLAQLQAHVAALQADSTSKQGQITTLQTEKDALQTHVSILQTDSTSKQGQITTLESEKDALQTHVSTLQTDSTSKQGQITTLQTETTTLQTEIADLQAQIATLQAQLDECGGTEVRSVKSTPEVYPNPTTGIVYVDNANNAEIKVHNLKGELLQTTRESRIDLSGKPNGVYLLRIEDVTLKVVKQ
ncbi:hypothetical protein SAMD00024442_22_5 [Candidatus Symbiothrix dinenymphae]|nr:hypothetical protein SAMD00024442_22_5 [Candidatus Symbiothrix dinenymphae]